MESLEPILMWAFDGNHIKVVRYIYQECGANFAHGCIWPIQLAAGKGLFDIVVFFVEECGADAGKAVPHASANGDLKMVKYLIDKCEPSQRLDICNNSIIWACRNGHLEVLRFLTETYGADVQIDDNRLIQDACENGYLAVVKYLIEACGVNVQANHNSAFFCACTNGHLEVVKYLIEKCGVDACVENNYAVQFACRYGQLEVVKYLIESCGVDPCSLDNLAIKYAFYNKHSDVVEYLVKNHGATLPVIN